MGPPQQPQVITAPRPAVVAPPVTPLRPPQVVAPPVQSSCINGAAVPEVANYWPAQQHTTSEEIGGAWGEPAADASSHANRQQTTPQQLDWQQQHAWQQVAWQQPEWQQPAW